MGEVWLAHDVQLAGRPVAIKIMHKHMMPNEEDVARFEREARIAAVMDHPNIVTVYTTGDYDGAPFMVMEYLRGQDLERAQPDGDAARIAAIGRDVCAALAYAHGKGVIHRDIKPGNLFLCDTGQVKVTDFGIARAASGTTLSVAGSLVGTFAYMPPEQWRGAPPAFSNDVWATGCVLYRLISGRPPRVFPDAAGYAAAALRGDPVPGLREVSGVPGWLADVVMAMLDPAPRRRPPARWPSSFGSAPRWPARRRLGRAFRRRGEPAASHHRHDADCRRADGGRPPAAAPGLGRRRDRGGAGAAGRWIARRVASPWLTAVLGQRRGQHVRPGGRRRRGDAGRAPPPRQGRVPDRFRARACLVGYPHRHAHGHCDVRPGLNRAGAGPDPRRGGHDLRQGAAGADRRRLQGGGQAPAPRADGDEHQPVRCGAGRQRDHRGVRRGPVNPAWPRTPRPG